MTKLKLTKGDMVIVSTVLGGEKEYPVIKIEGNKAHTKFRIFNTKIYLGGNIYEYGKRADSTTNEYRVKDVKRLALNKQQKFYWKFYDRLDDLGYGKVRKDIKNLTIKRDNILKQVVEEFARKEAEDND